MKRPLMHAWASMMHSIARLDRAIIRPRRQACPEDARTKRMSVRLTFCQPWVARLPPWSMRPWESPPPMRWRGGTDSHGRMDHRGSSHKLVKSSLMRVPMCRTRDARAPVPNSLRAPGWRRHDARVSAGARPENHGSSADLRASGWRRQGMRVSADARPEKHGSSADLRAGWMAPARHAGDARPGSRGSSADLRAGGWRRHATRFRTDARPASRGSNAGLDMLIGLDGRRARNAHRRVGIACRTGRASGAQPDWRPRW
jgi:hypothetical protein